jgi:putative protein-disulfide isomerase
MSADRHFLYVADPMCSWCYGFAPVMTTLRDTFAGRLPVKIMMGGLRAGNTRPMRQEDKDYISNAWARVSAATGQPFEQAFFERDAFVYDTEPACRAVVAVRRMKPEFALDFKSRISTAFYAENRDVTSTDELAKIADEAGLDPLAFRAAFLAPETRNDTFRDFLIAKEMGVEGFPMLAAGNEEDGYALITNGYRPIDGLIDAVDAWLDKGAPARSKT